MLITDASGRWSLSAESELRPALGFEYHRLDLGTPPSGVSSNLVDTSLVGATPIAAVDDWFVGLQAGAGYAGEASFSNGSGWYGKGVVIIGTEFDTRRSVAIWIDYDGNRDLLPDIPLPGFAYSVESEPLSWVLGFPQSSVTWRPAPAWTATASFELPLTIEASLAYEISSDWRVTAAYARRTTAFHSESLRARDRLFFEEETISLTARRAWSGRDGGGLEAGVGWGFGRELAVGFDDRDTRVLERFGSSIFFRLSAEFRF